MTDKSYLPEGGLFGTPQNTEYISSREMLERAMREGRILEALAVKCDCTEMTLTVDLGGMNGYIKRDSAASVSYTHLDVYKRQAIIATDK